MKTAIVLGGGETLHQDLEDLNLKYEGVLACNEAGAIWPGQLDAWVTLHPNKFGTWISQRKDNGHPKALGLWAHNKRAGIEVHSTKYMFPGQARSGSSGCFAAKVALLDMGFDRVVLCGIPMTPRPHFFDNKNWRAADGFRRAWQELPMVYRNKMRSMSGWTRVLLGSPKDWELDADNKQNQRDHNTPIASQTVSG